MYRNLFPAIFAAAALLTTAVSGQTVLDVIRQQPELSQFSTAITKAGLGEDLSNTAGIFTVFAPSNAGIATDDAFSIYMTTDSWIEHLTANIRAMILENVILVDGDIFDQTRTEVTAVSGDVLAVSQIFAQVQLVGVTTPNLSADNGIVHIMDGVIKPAWRLQTLRDVGVHDELVEQLEPILDRIQFNDPLTIFVPSGTTWIAGRNRAYVSGEPEIIGELQDPNRVAETTDAYFYNLIDQNIYAEDIEPGFQILVFPRNDVAHMWVTRDADDRTGQMRFNDAEIDRQYVTDNGVGQIVKKVLVPPGLIEFMEITALYTTLNLKDMVQMFKASAWDRRDMSKSIGTGQGPSFNVFAPLQDGFGEFNSEDLIRLSTLQWERHLWNFLQHLMFEPAMTTDELYTWVESEGGLVSKKTLSGFNVTFQIDEGGEITIDGARFVRPYDIKAVDGYLHVVATCPLPPSVLYSVYDQTAMNPLMEVQTTFIDSVQLGVFIDTLLPVTMFTAPNWAWNIQIPTLEIEDTLKNMIFRGLLYDDVLAGMHNETIMSTNDKLWLIEVYNGIVYLSNTGGVLGLTNVTFLGGPNTTNILARTGVIHHINGVMYDVNYTISSPTPTFAPFAAAAPVVLGAPVVFGSIAIPGSPVPPQAAPTDEPAAVADSAAEAVHNFYIPRTLMAVASLILAHVFL